MSGINESLCQEYLIRAADAVAAGCRDTQLKDTWFKIADTIGNWRDSGESPISIALAEMHFGSYELLCPGRQAGLLSSRHHRSAEIKVGRLC